MGQWFELDTGEIISAIIVPLIGYYGLKKIVE